MPREERSLVDEQIAYYRARAPEYDATARPAGDPLAPYGNALESALRAFEPRGKVLEIACGTGQYTRLLAEYAAELTALDASAEMIELNRAKVGGGVAYVRANIFEWEPDAAYDVVFFGFWLSHVPPQLFERFWEIVRGCLSPSGRVCFADEAFDPWRIEQLLEGPNAPVVERRPNDGSLHRVVKVFWEVDELEARLRSMGWEMKVQQVGPFYWGAGAPRSQASRESPAGR